MLQDFSYFVKTIMSWHDLNNLILNQNIHIPQRNILCYQQNFGIYLHYFVVPGCRKFLQILLYIGIFHKTDKSKSKWV